MHYGYGYSKETERERECGCSKGVGTVSTSFSTLQIFLFYFFCGEGKDETAYCRYVPAWDEIPALHVASKRDVEGRENTFFCYIGSMFYLGSSPGSRLLGHHSLVGGGGCLRNIN